MNPSEPQPPPLPSNQPAPFAQRAPDSGRRFLRQFLAGALGGAALSAIIWMPAFKSLDNPGGLIVIGAVPAFKLALGIPLLCYRQWRGLGAGIMVSIALGFLIFFGTCLTHIDQFH